MRFWAALLLLAGCAAAGGQAMPAQLQDRWRIEKVVARAPAACWDEGRAAGLVGTQLRYGQGQMFWQGGPVAVPEVVSRTLSARKFLEESKLALSDLGIKAPQVLEFDLQHEDADITGATTEVPGDTVLVAGPQRIVLSVCGVYYLAFRLAH